MNIYNTLIPPNEFQTVTPSNDGVWTVRTLNTGSPSNSGLANVYELTSVPSNIPFSQGTCFNNINNLYTITSKEELYIYLCDVLIRFDTNPNYYQKDDYKALLRMLMGALLHVYDVYASPSQYKITTSPYILLDIIPIGHLIKNIMVYNNELFSVTMNLGYSIDGQDLLMEETIESKTWLSLTANKLVSLSLTTSLYFDCTETLTSSGIYVVVDSNLYFSTP